MTLSMQAPHRVTCVVIYGTYKIVFRQLSITIYFLSFLALVDLYTQALTQYQLNKILRKFLCSVNLYSRNRKNCI
jgi:hypothetical protein